MLRTVKAIAFLLMATISAFFTSGCSDKSVCSSENLINAINNVLSKQAIYIAIPCTPLEENKPVPPFVVIDPMMGNKNVVKGSNHRKDIYLNRLVKYAKLLEQSGAISLKKSSFKIHSPFSGLVKRNGYIVDYHRDISRTLELTEYYGVGKANIGTIEVREITKTTKPFYVEGIKCVDISFTVKLSKLISCISEEVLLASYAQEEVDNAEATYRLYLDEDAKEWKVKNKKPLLIDPIRRYFMSLLVAK